MSVAISVSLSQGHCRFFARASAKLPPGVTAKSLVAEDLQRSTAII
jgi:hypothetical protein